MPNATPSSTSIACAFVSPYTVQIQFVWRGLTNFGCYVDKNAPTARQCRLQGICIGRISLEYLYSKLCHSLSLGRGFIPSDTSDLEFGILDERLND
jgi:hypothetical protein